MQSSGRIYYPYRTRPQSEGETPVTRAIVGLCTIELEIPEAFSLKDKRSVIKSLLARLRYEHHVAAAEIDLLDDPRASVIAFANVSNSSRHLDMTLSEAARWIERTYPQVEVIEQQVEIL
jgi:uncharacterized protein YlxP (DUF503 family)